MVVTRVRCGYVTIPEIIFECPINQLPCLECGSMTWNLRDDNAFLETSSIRVVACLQDFSPSIRIVDSTSTEEETKGFVQIRPVDSSIPSPEIGLSLGEAYVRQGDVIASYPERAPWSFGYQLDIRSNHEIGIQSGKESSLLTLEVWLSVQTSLLNSHPELNVTLEGDLFSQLGNGFWLDSKCRVALLVHPLDLADCKISSETGSGPNRRIQMKVFGRFMEKGVIRRMRFRILVANEPSSREFWQDCWNEFSESPLPLTT